MKSYNKPPTKNRLLKPFAVVALSLGFASLAGAAGHEAHKNAEAKDAAIERQLESIIDPEIDARGSEALAKYEAQPDKEKGKMKLNVDPNKGTATITAHGEHSTAIDGQNIGNKFSDMKIIMGLRDGKPNPEDTRLAWYRIETTSLDGNTSHQVQLAAPGTERDRSSTLSTLGGGDGWSASARSASTIGEGSFGGGLGTGKRDGDMQPTEAAHDVIADGRQLVPEVMAELS